MATKQLMTEVGEPTFEMGMYNKAMLEEPLTGFDLYLKEQGIDKEAYWALPIPEQIAWEDKFAKVPKKKKKAAGCCGD